MHKYIYFIFLIVLVFLTACEDKHHTDIEPEDPDTNRTLLVYIGRDNNLSTTIEEKIEYILRGWSGKGGNLVFYQDKLGEGAHLYETITENGKNSIREIASYGEENSADPAIFGRVIQDVRTAYPAESYGMIFFSHATGWLPEKVYEQTRTIGRDGTDEMDLAEFAAAIPDNLFDFIIFEACHMAGIEVVYELRNKTDYILASAAEIVSPGFRYIYPQSIDYLFQPEANLSSFAENAFEWVNSQTDAYRSGTLSIIQTSGLNTLAQWLNNNMDRDFTGNYNSLQIFDRKKENLFYDFQEYFSYRIAPQQQETFNTLIENCVIYANATPGFFSGMSSSYYPFVIEKHCGLTTYIMKEHLQEINEAYTQLAWYKDVY